MALLNDIYAVFPPNNYHSVNISPVISLIHLHYKTARLKSSD